MHPSIVLANAMIEFIAFFMPMFIAMVVIEWALKFFKEDW